MPRKKMSFVRIALLAVLIVTGVYVVCLIALTLAQRRLMYFPCVTPRAELERVAKTAGFKVWHDAKGEPIGWQRSSPRTPAGRCILVLHGNAGCAPDRFHYADTFQAIEPIEFYILEYPGYGGRPGAPTQTNLLQAAKQALDNIPNHCAVFVVAESLGTGVAAWLAGTHPARVRGLLLIAPYNNMTAVAKRHLPLFPVRTMLRDRYPASAWLAPYRGPVAVLLAGKDQVVPSDLGRDLFETYPGPKKLWIETDLGHNDLHLAGNDVWREVVQFWREH